MRSSPTQTPKQCLAITLAVFVLFAVILLTNAWLVDDAYITFRTVDNFVNGYGLTWNPAERVQVYTHPLWMLSVSFIYAITNEIFFTVILFSFALTIASVLIAWPTVSQRRLDLWWKGLLLLVALLSSKAVIDYASSGLENPMSYVIAALFMFVFLSAVRAQTPAKRNIAILFFLASLAFLNRVDTILLYIPALIWVLYRSRSMPIGQLAGIIVVATLPATFWLGFSLVYYGYPFPNTAYAKALANDFPLAWKLQRGSEYQMNSLRWDTASYAMLIAVLWYAATRRAATTIALLLGIAWYLLFVLFSAASATHMSGRFYAVPLFIAIILFVYHVTNPRFALIVCALLIAYNLWNPVSALKFGTPAYVAYQQNANHIDTKWFVWNEGAALLNWRSGKQMPDHVWYQWGKDLRNQEEQVLVGGAFGGEPISYAGFAAGPEKHFIDLVALSDPLLARLPANMPDEMDQWKSGHFHRSIPEGYVESIEQNENLLREPELRAYYGLVRRITRDAIFSRDRFWVIVNMNLGRYDHLVHQS